jgi:hypothetical protein
MDAKPETECKCDGLSVDKPGKKGHGRRLHEHCLESCGPEDQCNPEGVGYAYQNRFLQENIPVGEYLIEIAAPLVPWMKSAPYIINTKFVIKEKETAKVHLEIPVLDMISRLPSK